MAFLDNSGDIILDAVLTDTGRLRMAQGDGSFKISKFALGDDEINYALYDKDHLSGSAYYDLQVLQTPVLEAFTNNTSNIKTKLVTMARTNVMYMPVLKLNNNNIADSTIQKGNSKYFSRAGNSDNSALPTGANLSSGTNAAAVSKGKFYIAVDEDTYRAFNQYRTDDDGITDSQPFDVGNLTTGLIAGFSSTTAGHGADSAIIRVDHGLDTSEVAPAVGLDSDLLESAFIVELDYRLGRVKLAASDSVAPVNFIDDDNQATYYLTSVGGAGSFINPKPNGAIPKNTNAGGLSLTELSTQQNPQVFAGPRGNTLHFRIHASQELRQSTYLYNQMGATSDCDTAGNIGGFATDDGLVDGKKIYYIDSTVRVIGANTGYRLDIPIRFIKLAL